MDWADPTYCRWRLFRHARRWSAATGAAIDRSSPAVAGGLVYAGSRDGMLYAFDAVTGAVRWTAATGGLVYCSPAVADGTVYIAAGQVYVYSDDGSQIGEIDVPERPTSLALSKDGRTLYILARTSLYSTSVR